MYLKEFPNIDWVRKNANNDFVNGRDYRGNTLRSAGWPNVILKVQSIGTERDQIKGPFSLFLNLAGKANVRLDHKWYGISDSFYCLSNEDEVYDLHIPMEQKAITSNIHFGKVLFDDVLNNVSTEDQGLLDNNDHQIDPFGVLPKTRFLKDHIRLKIHQLHQYQDHVGVDYSLDREYELMAEILQYLMQDASREFNKMSRLQSKKPSTRRELLKRANIGLDYIHGQDLLAFDLDDVSQECGLSKFHFIRVFKEVHGLTPTQYAARLIEKKARRLVVESKLDFQTIAISLGFSELSAFTRFFKRETGITPTALRLNN